MRPFCRNGVRHSASCPRRTVGCKTTRMKNLKGNDTLLSRAQAASPTSILIPTDKRGRNATTGCAMLRNSTKARRLRLRPARVESGADLCVLVCQLEYVLRQAGRLDNAPDFDRPLFFNKPPYRVEHIRRKLGSD